MAERAPSTRKRKPAAKREAAPKAIGRDRPHITIEPEPLQEFNESVNILVFGNPGIGKTTLAGGVSDSVFLSTEKGVVAAKRTGSKARLLRAPDWPHTEAGLEWANNHLGIDDWLIVDSITKMQILMLRDILGTIHEENESRSLDIPAIQDHQQWQNQYMRFIDRIVDAKYNSILVATAMHREDPEGESLVLPSITGKDYTISAYCCAQMDAVFYYGMKGEQRRLLTQAYPPYFAKNRFADTLPQWFDIGEGDYSALDRIIDLILGDLDG